MLNNVTRKGSPALPQINDAVHTLLRTKIARRRNFEGSIGKFAEEIRIRNFHFRVILVGLYTVTRLMEKVVKDSWV